jgi:hypothetical protein
VDSRMVLIGKIGGLTTSGRHDPRPKMAKARTAFLRHFDIEADPDQILPPDERQRRGEALYKAHMARLAAKSALARARRSS